MSFDRREITRLTVRNPDKRTYANEEPQRSPAADDAAMAREGYHTLDRADPRNPWNSHRRGLTPPVTEEPNSDRGETAPAVVKY
jgi:hypothetical protein